MSAPRATAQLAGLGGGEILIIAIVVVFVLVGVAVAARVVRRR
jgi:hypothetical protein